MKTWTTAIVCVAGLLLPVTAQDFKDWDTNGDGVVSRDEFQGPDKLWERLDANTDGQLAGDELGGTTKTRPERTEGDRPKKDGAPDRAAIEEKMRARFAEMDANGDGFLSAEEFPRPEAMTRVDTDGDGQVSLDEMLARAGEDQIRNNLRKLKEADTDGDGQISREEFPGPPELFDRLDSNGDGLITREEVEKLAKERGEGQGQGPGRIFEKLDADQSGTLGSDEWDARLDGRIGTFATVDADGDGQVTKEEIMAVQRGKGQEGGNPDKKPGRERKKKEPGID